MKRIISIIVIIVGLNSLVSAQSAETCSFRNKIARILETAQIFKMNDGKTLPSFNSYFAHNAERDKKWIESVIRDCKLMQKIMKCNKGSEEKRKIKRILKKASLALAIKPNDLFSRLRNGKNLLEIAGAKEISKEKLISALKSVAINEKQQVVAVFWQRRDRKKKPALCIFEPISRRNGTHATTMLTQDKLAYEVGDIVRLLFIQESAYIKIKKSKVLGKVSDKTIDEAKKVYRALRNKFYKKDSPEKIEELPSHIGFDPNQKLLVITFTESAKISRGIQRNRFQIVFDWDNLELKPGKTNIYVSRALKKTRSKAREKI